MILVAREAPELTALALREVLRIRATVIYRFEHEVQKEILMTIAMNFWTDLIWIGNTLYPRWFVIGVVASPVIVVIVIGLVVRIVKLTVGRGKC